MGGNSNAEGNVTTYLLKIMGRRTLHLMSLAGVIVSLLMITIILQYSRLDSAATLMVIFSGLLVAFCSILTTHAFIALVECFTQGPRGAAMSVGLALYILVEGLVLLVYPQMELEFLNYSLVPFLLIEMVLFVILFLYFPETKNKTSYEIALLFQVQNTWTTAVGLKKPTEKEPLKSQYPAYYGSEMNIPE